MKPVIEMADLCLSYLSPLKTPQKRALLGMAHKTLEKNCIPQNKIFYANVLNNPLKVAAKYLFGATEKNYKKSQPEWLSNNDLISEDVSTKSPIVTLNGILESLFKKLSAIEYSSPKLYTGSAWERSWERSWERHKKERIYHTRWVKWRYEGAVRELKKMHNRLSALRMEKKTLFNKAQHCGLVSKKYSYINLHKINDKALAEQLPVACAIVNYNLQVNLAKDFIKSMRKSALRKGWLNAVQNNWGYIDKIEKTTTKIWNKLSTFFGLLNLIDRDLRVLPLCKEEDASNIIAPLIQLYKKKKSVLTAEKIKKLISKLWEGYIEKGNTTLTMAEMAKIEDSLEGFGES